MEQQKYDLIVVGGGFYGLPIIKTYLEINPSSRVLLLDAGKSIGGTWSAERLYPGLQSNNVAGFLEFSDFPMDSDTYHIAARKHIPGYVIHRYLNAYVDHFGFRDRIRLGATVKSAELRDDDLWLVIYDQAATRIDEQAQEQILLARKLVLATGTTSAPIMPTFPGSDKFGGAIFHSMELGSRTADMEAAENVLVIGGSKSAADAVYMNASKGRHVDWIIRESGGGPRWLSPPFVSPFNFCFESLATTRALTFLSPALDMDYYSGIRTLLHNTRFGRLVLKAFFGIIMQDILTSGRFNEHPETKKLVPSTSVFWSGTSVGIFNYPTDFFGLIRQGLVHVHIADITFLSHNTVHIRLPSSETVGIPANIIICATSYKHDPTVRILPESVSTNRLGLRTAAATTASDKLVRSADAEIARLFPGLTPDNQPQPPAVAHDHEHANQASWSLYRGLVPPAFLESRNLAYAGMVTSLRGCLTSEISALWTTEFLDGTLETPSEAEAEWAALLQQRFWRARAPRGLGARGPDMVFEIMPYVDTLLRDLGLPTARKGSWWRELFESYGVRDYKGLVGEWIEMRMRTANKKM